MVVEQQHRGERPGTVRGEQRGADAFVVGEGEGDQLPRVAVALGGLSVLGGVRRPVLAVDEKVLLDHGTSLPTPSAEVADR